MTTAGCRYRPGWREIAERRIDDFCAPMQLEPIERI
jgi:hypothetical protein